MYRPQQYREVNRAFGPYLPPHPMRGLGAYRGMGAADCSEQQAQYDQAQSDYRGFQANYNPNEPDDRDMLSKLEANLNAVANQLSYCKSQDSTEEPNPWGKFSQNTVNLQDYINQNIAALIAAGNPDGTVCYLQKDGILGATTCGAAKQTGATVPSTCKSFTVSRCPNQMPGGGGTKPPGPGPGPVKLTCPAGTVPSADGKTCVKPSTPVPAKTASNNTMFILGGLALVGVGAFILLRKKH